MVRTSGIFCFLLALAVLLPGHSFADREDHPHPYCETLLSQLEASRLISDQTERVEREWEKHRKPGLFVRMRWPLWPIARLKSALEIQNVEENGVDAAFLYREVSILAFKVMRDGHLFDGVVLSPGAFEKKKAKFEKKKDKTEEEIAAMALEEAMVTVADWRRRYGAYPESINLALDQASTFEAREFAFPRWGVQLGVPVSRWKMRKEGFLSWIFGGFWTRGRRDDTTVANRVFTPVLREGGLRQDGESWDPHVLEAGEARVRLAKLDEKAEQGRKRILGGWWSSGELWKRMREQAELRNMLEIYRTLLVRSILKTAVDVDPGREDWAEELRRVLEARKSEAEGVRVKGEEAQRARRVIDGVIEEAIRIVRTEEMTDGEFGAYVRGWSEEVRAKIEENREAIDSDRNLSRIVRELLRKIDEFLMRVDVPDPPGSADPGNTAEPTTGDEADPEAPGVERHRQLGLVLGGEDGLFAEGEVSQPLTSKEFLEWAEAFRERLEIHFSEGDERLLFQVKEYIEVRELLGRPDLRPRVDRLKRQEWAEFWAELKQWIRPRREGMEKGAVGQIWASLSEFDKRTLGRIDPKVRSGIYRLGTHLFRYGVGLSLAGGVAGSIFTGASKTDVGIAVLDAIFGKNRDLVVVAESETPSEWEARMIAFIEKRHPDMLLALQESGGDPRVLREFLDEIADNVLVLGEIGSDVQARRIARGIGLDGHTFGNLISVEEEARGEVVLATELQFYPKLEAHFISGAPPPVREAYRTLGADPEVLADWFERLQTEAEIETFEDEAMASAQAEVLSELRTVLYLRTECAAATVPLDRFRELKAERIFRAIEVWHDDYVEASLGIDGLMDRVGN